MRCARPLPATPPPPRPHPEACAPDPRARVDRPLRTLSEDEIDRRIGTRLAGFVLDRDLELEGAVVVDIAAHDGIAVPVDQRQPPDAGTSEAERLIVREHVVGIDRLE